MISNVFPEKLRNIFVRGFKKEDRDLKTGLFHYLVNTEYEKSRVHLRIDPDGHGTLIVNANRVMHLNQTACLIAQLVLEKKPEDEAVKIIRKKFQVGEDQVRQDWDLISSQVMELTRPDGACPIHEMDLDTIPPFSTRPTAPYRMDLALTYRCNNQCSHCYNERDRIQTELSTIEWKKVLDITWNLGIPHIVFTGGEPTLREDLPELIAYAEANGQITGLNTNGRRLADEKYLTSLVNAGLDHVQITVESNSAQVHNEMVKAKAFDQTISGLKNALASPLYVMTNTTMLKTNIQTIPATLDLFGELGLKTVGLNALIHSGKGATVGTGLPESELTSLLQLAREKTQARNQKLIWYTPTQYCGFDPQMLNLGVKGCTAALYNMCVEPDGAVLPCQSYYSPVGNLLSSDWDQIWNHELCLSLRERKNLPVKCNSCALISECGGGCPLEFNQ